MFQNTVLTFLVSLKATTEDLKHLNQLFLSLDTSHDGQLSMAELQDGMELILDQLEREGKKKGNIAQRIREYEKLMDEIDVNKDGFIDYTEFITAAVNKAVILNEENLEAAFRLIDRDNSGSITVEELQDAFDSHGDKDP